MSLSRATANGFTDARPVTSRSSSTYSNNNNGGSPGFFERHNPFLSRGNRPRTSTADSSYGGNALDQPEPSSPRRRSGLRPGLGRFSSSASQLPLDSNGRAPFPTSPSRPDSRAAAAAGASTEELVSPTEPSMHSMARTNSGNGLSGGGSSSRDREGGSALGRMFRRYSQGQHGIPRTTSSSGIDSQAAATRTAVTGSTAQPASSSLPPNARSNSSSRDVSAGGAAAAPNGDSAGIENLPGAIAAAQGLPLDAAPSSPAPGASTAAAAAAPAGTNPSPQAGVHRIRLVPHLEATRSLHFEPIERDLREGTVAVKIGRFTDRTPAAAPAEDAQGGTLNNNTSTAAAATTAGAVSSNQPLGAGPGNRGGAVPSSAGGGGRIDSSRIAFKSKVVSRGHAELWCEPGGRFFIKDTKSSSGTFLNHIRLSAPNVESRPFPVKDGDILQLGVDYQGGTEEIYRCVKIRVELNRGWQREANQFNVNALRQLRALQGSPLPAATAPATQSKASPSDAAGVVAAAAAASGSSLPTNRQTMNVTDCCICLFSVTVCQALFIAPCSHVFHYKCIRPLLNMHHPGFSCPLCRTFADLEADVEQDEEWQEALLKEAEAAEMARVGGGTGAAAGEPATPAVDRHVDGPPPMVAGGAASSSQGHDSNGSSSGAAPRTVSPAGAELATSPSASGLPNTPSIPSGLRQQLQLDRPTTAVGDDTTGVLDQTAVMGMGGAQHDEEMQEVMQDAIAGDESEVSAAATHGSSGGGRLASTSPRHSTIDEESLEAANASANRSLDSSADNDATLFPGQRRGSQPINIRSSSGASSSGAGGDVSLSGFSPLEEARTPVNQHVLSVLAEAPPPRSMAARRLAAAQNGDATTGAATGSGGAGGSGMPSLGASSSLLSVPPQAGTSSSSSTSPPTASPNNNNLDSRRGSAVSEDVGFQTPGEGNSVDHSHSGFTAGGAGAGASNSLAFPGQQQQQSSSSAAAGGEQARTRNSGSAGSGGSSGSHQASPSTAGDVDGEGSEAEPEAGAEGASSSSRRTPAKPKAATGDAAAARRERSADSRASSTASGGAGGGSRAAGGGGGAATTTSPRGKMKMFLKKAAGA